MRYYPIVLGALVVMLGGCQPTLIHSTSASDPTLKDVLIQLKRDLTNINRSPKTSVDGQLSCDIKDKPLVLHRKKMFAKASLNISDSREHESELGVDELPVIKIGVSGSSNQSDAFTRVSSSEFEFGIPLTNQSTPLAQQSKLGKLVTAAETDLLTMPHDAPCLTPQTLTVTTAIQITRKNGKEVEINYLLVSGKRSWSREHAYDGTISVTISYDGGSAAIQ